ncbi:Threonylcarbamoyl-AMP synthase [hydrothermal vent metagenome]|uniref:L-threonylcarbamoyladenylate synthase n=1 Tax=hydrothermal vent metagenome TaxID=652676 RepID=A0A3B0Y3C2_9ZZZZ
MPSKFQINQAASIIHNEGIIAYPTESVYGLGCDPLSETAVTAILQLKHRPLEKGLIIIAASLQQLQPYIDITPDQAKTITQYTRAMTWLVKKSIHTPPWISGKHPKIAIRVSQHPLVKQLCQRLQHPIVSTSANPSGAKPAVSAFQSRRYFKNQVNMYLNGKTGELKQPTPITDLQNNRQIRE